jgi:transcription initiation factor IIE alpha subunit
LIEILECVKRHGERLDSQIAEETGVSVAEVRERAAGLAASGALVTCNLTRFDNGERIDAWVYRVSGYIPPAAPGRKAKPAK